MIKSASLSEELFIVLVPDNKFLYSVLKLQRKVGEIYNLFENDKYPQLHITVDRVKKAFKQETEVVIEQFVNHAEPVQIKIDHYSCFYLTDDRHLVLKLAETESLFNFAYGIHNRLKSADLSTIEDYEEWIFHISVVNNIFADNPIPLDEFDNICLLLEGLESPSTFTVDTLQIWKPTMEAEEKIVRSYDLK